MPLGKTWFGLAAAGLLTAGVAVAPASAATAAPVSRIYSAAQNTCLDVSTTGGYFVYVYGNPCTGSAAQAFAFHAVAGAPAGTYEITSRSTGQCLAQYRFGVRQQSCAGSVPPDPTNVEWTLQRVGTSGYRYKFVVTSTLGTVSPRCVEVDPQAGGYPGPTFNLTACATGVAAQVLSLTTAP